MNIGEAVQAMKQGKKVGRPGWNGKNMYLFLLSANGLYEPCICMFTAKGNFQPGWLASQPDLLAEDWEIIG